MVLVPYGYEFSLCVWEGVGVVCVCVCVCLGLGYQKSSVQLGSG